MKKAIALATAAVWLLAGCSGNHQQDASASQAPATPVTSPAAATAKPATKTPSKKNTAAPSALPSAAGKNVASKAANSTAQKSSVPAAAAPTHKQTAVTAAPHAAPATVAPVVHVATARPATPAPTKAPVVAAISFTASQASAGQAVYAQSCAMCHGATLHGASAPSIAPSATLHTIGAFYSFMSSRMPLTAPGSLSSTQYVDLMAYVLEHNGYEDNGTPLTSSAAAGSSARIPAP
ncbi:MAG: c-type cytochrome [Vulcanimicrobiaceae bacterium]